MLWRKWLTSFWWRGEALEKMVASMKFWETRGEGEVSSFWDGWLSTFSLPGKFLTLRFWQSFERKKCQLLLTRADCDGDINRNADNSAPTWQKLDCPGGGWWQWPWLASPHGHRSVHVMTMVMAMVMVLGDGNGLGYGHRLVHMLFSRTGCGRYGEICCLGKRWSKLDIFETQPFINYFWA